MLASERAVTPPPSWVSASAFRLLQEDVLAAQILDVRHRLETVEAEKRKLFDVLAIVAARPESETMELGQAALDRVMSQQPPEQLRKLAKHARAEVRTAAERALERKK